MNPTVTSLRRAAARESWTLRYQTAPHTAPGGDWLRLAACRGLPADAVTPAHCAGCQVRLQCLHDAFAVENDLPTSQIFHVRGGLPAAVRAAAEVDRRRRLAADVHPLVAAVMSAEDEAA